MLNNKDKKIKIERSCFGAGCFWGVEYVFRQFNGVLKTKTGFMGGYVKKPSYEDVCCMNTGHIEVVYIEYNPEKISYNKLLEIFFKSHNPSQEDGQGPDIGEQYKSVIFYYNEIQKKEAENFKAEYQKMIGKKVFTIIESAKEFYEAGEEHQKYYEKKNAKPYCHVVPKVKI